MYENLIFDFGQVIVHFKPEYMTSRYVSDKSDIDLVSQVVFDRLYWDKLDSGDITDEQVRDGISQRLPERLRNAAISVYDNWYLNLPLMEGVLEFLKELKTSGKKLYLLSNISSGFAANYHKNSQVKEIFDMFDGLVFSGTLGIVKPTAAIFDHITKKYSLNKSKTVFIDDNKANIKGAQDFGIKGYLFDGDIFKLKEFLK